MNCCRLLSYLLQNLIEIIILHFFQQTINLIFPIFFLICWQIILFYKMLYLDQPADLIFSPLPITAVIGCSSK